MPGHWILAKRMPKPQRTYLRAWSSHRPIGRPLLQECRNLLRCAGFSGSKPTR